MAGRRFWSCVAEDLVVVGVGHPRAVHGRRVATARGRLERKALPAGRLAPTYIDSDLLQSDAPLPMSRFRNEVPKPLGSDCQQQDRARTKSVALPLVRAAHPVPGFAVNLLTVLLAARMGVSPRTTVALFVAVLSGQLVVGWTNDLFDRERDRRVGSCDKPLATGQISVGLVRSVVGAASVVCVLASMWADSVPASFISRWV